MIKYVAGNFEIYFPKNSTSVQDIDSMGDSINASQLSFQDDPKVKIMISNQATLNVVDKKTLVEKNVKKLNQFLGGSL